VTQFPSVFFLHLLRREPLGISGTSIGVTKAATSFCQESGGIWEATGNALTPLVRVRWQEGHLARKTRAKTDKNCKINYVWTRTAGKLFTVSNCLQTTEVGVNASLELVANFCYLGDMLIVDGDADLKATVWKGWNKFRKLMPLSTHNVFSFWWNGSYTGVVCEVEPCTRGDVLPATALPLWCCPHHRPVPKIGLATLWILEYPFLHVCVCRNNVTNGQCLIVSQYYCIMQFKVNSTVWM